MRAAAEILDERDLLLSRERREILGRRRIDESRP
jgi:hypothetical protein